MRCCLILVDYKRLFSQVARDGEIYRENSPFPHIAIDGFLGEEVASQVSSSFPRLEDVSWNHMDLSESANPPQLNKYHLSLGTKKFENELRLDSVVRNLLLELNSGLFVQYLQQLTGIPALISDPKMWGGGFHQTMPGGLLKIHADFRTHPIYKFDRRLNLLLYLNENWEEEWGGMLELWDKGMSKCEKSLLPILDRCVIFNTDMHSFHGHPKPLRCPEGVSRRSIALYYYTVKDNDGEVVIPETHWQESP
jgi:Rps23 Pro-64 3,4-dihydroxylase Tpa1-like proline 4-hydroxylase